MFTLPQNSLTQSLWSSLLNQGSKTSSTNPSTTTQQTAAAPGTSSVRGSDSIAPSTPVSAPAASTETESGVRFAFSDAAMAAARQASSDAEASQPESDKAQSSNAQAGTTEATDAELAPETIKPLAGPALPLPAPVADVTEPVVVAESAPVASTAVEPKADTPVASATADADPAPATNSSPAATSTSSAASASTSTSSAPARNAADQTSASEKAPEPTSDEEQARAAAIAAHNRGKLISMVAQLRGDQGSPRTNLAVTADEAPKAAASTSRRIAA